MSYPEYQQVSNKRRNRIMIRLRRWWKRYTTSYVDLGEDALGKMPPLAPIGDEPVGGSDMAESVYTHDESVTLFDTNSIQSPSRQQSTFDSDSFCRAASGGETADYMMSDTDELYAEAQEQHIDFEYYERQSATCGSLESIDSLAESYWDLDETVEVSSSQVTPVVTNIRSKMHQEFFAEHVRFLRIQTKPRKVEIIWAKKKHP